MNRLGSSRILVAVVLASMAVAAGLLMTQEQRARQSAGQLSDQLMEILDSGKPVTPEEVHAQIARRPAVTRSPGRHRYVEEYHCRGPLSSYTVYAYYRTAAAKLLEAVSMNQQLEDWEQPDAAADFDAADGR